MKTAMQEIMDIVEMDHNNGVEISMKVFYKMLQDGIEKEKQQIIDAYWGGLNGSINDWSEAKEVGGKIIGIKHGEGAEQYYNQTFNQQS